MMFRTRTVFAFGFATLVLAGSADLAAARRLHVTRYHHRGLHARYAYGPGHQDAAFAAGAVLGLFGAGISGASDAYPAPAYGYYRPGYYGPGYGAPGY